MKQFIKAVRLSSMPDHNSYLANLAVVNNLNKLGELSFTSNVTFFVGENGTGKSTLLEAIAVSLGFNPEGGTRNFCFNTNESHSSLFNHITVSRTTLPRDGFFLRAESFYNVASYIDKLDESLVKSYGGVSLHNQSHGESFLSLIQNRFGGNGLYILDEPEAALSPTSLMALLCEINTLVENDSQFIIATHSPILLAFPKAQIIELTEHSIKTVEYKQTEHYQLTKNFLDNPERMIKYLFAQN